MRQSSKKQVCFCFGCELHTHKKASPVLDCPWLEKYNTVLLRTISTHRKALSHTCRKGEACLLSLQKIGRLRQTGSAHRGLSLNRQVIQKPNQPRLLSTPYNSSGNCVGIDDTELSEPSRSLDLSVFPFKLSDCFLVLLPEHIFVHISSDIESGLVVCGTFLHILLEAEASNFGIRRTIPVFGKTDLYQNVTGRRWFFPTCCRWCSWPAS